MFTRCRNALIERPCLRRGSSPSLLLAASKEFPKPLSTNSWRSRMPTTVLLSVKPRFAEAILDGEKKFEFRRAVFRDPGVERVVLYASSPVQRVIGEFEVESIVAMDPESLWQHTETHAGIKKEYFDEYFAGRELGFAVAVGQTR